MVAGQTDNLQHVNRYIIRFLEKGHQLISHYQDGKETKKKEAQHCD
jgi:hypothetical protein